VTGSSHHNYLVIPHVLRPKKTVDFISIFRDNTCIEMRSAAMNQEEINAANAEFVSDIVEQIARLNGTQLDMLAEQLVQNGLGNKIEFLIGVYARESFDD